MMDKNLAFAGFSVLVALLVVALFWYVMWKFVLEPNPLIREFFDLDVPMPKMPSVPSSAGTKTTDANTNADAYRDTARNRNDSDKNK